MKIQARNVNISAGNVCISEACVINMRIYSPYPSEPDITAAFYGRRLDQYFGAPDNKQSRCTKAANSGVYLCGSERERGRAFRKSPARAPRRQNCAALTNQDSAKPVKQKDGNFEDQVPKIKAL